MVYLVKVGGFSEYVFHDSEDALGFAKTAKLAQIDGKEVNITLHTDDEWADENKKEDE